MVQAKNTECNIVTAHDLKEGDTALIKDLDNVTHLVYVFKHISSSCCVMVSLSHKHTYWTNLNSLPVIRVLKHGEQLTIKYEC